MPQCYRCGGWKPDFSSCITCDDRNIKEQQNRKLVNSIEESGRVQAAIAAESGRVQTTIAVIQAIHQAKQAEEQSKKLVELEKDKLKEQKKLVDLEKARLREQKKQTQILLEQTLTVEEVFQRGFNFVVENDEYVDAQEIDSNTGQVLTPDHLNCVNVNLSEEGALVPRFDNPYVQGKFRKAYQEGIEHKIKQDYPQGPGFEYVRECAFDAGYARKSHPLIFYPKIVNKRISHMEHGGSRYSFVMEWLRLPDFEEVVDSHTGRLNYTWNPPYQTELLNLSFGAGVNSYIEEQNTEKLKEMRLAKIRMGKSLDPKSPTASSIEKELRESEDRRKIAAELSGVDVFEAVIFSALKGGIWGAVLSVPIWIVSHYFFGASWALVGIIEASAAMAAFIGLVYGSLKMKAFFSLGLAGCVVIAAFGTEVGRSFISRFWGGGLSREIKSLVYGFDSFFANIYGKMNSLSDAGSTILLFLGACVIAVVLLRLLGD
ncbi:MAG: hypothetical protein WCL28_13105 [bacterium]